MGERIEQKIEKQQYIMFPIILNETNTITLQKLEVVDKNQSSKPITSDDCSLCQHLSENQQMAIQNQIMQINSLYDSIRGELGKDEFDKVLTTTCKFKKPPTIESVMPSFLYGAEAIGKYSNYNYDLITQTSISESQEKDKNNIKGQQPINENKIKEKEIREKEIREILYCLIYDGESLEELNQTINELDQQKLTDSQEQLTKIYSKSIFVFVDGQTNFEKIFKSSFSQKDITTINDFLQNYQTSENFGYLIELKDFVFSQNVQEGDSLSPNQFLQSNILNHSSIYFVILPSFFDRVYLQRWILLGVTRFIDPTYVIVCASNQQFKETFLLDCLNKIHNKNQYFGLQWKKFSDNPHKTEINIFNNDNLIQTDSLFAIKKFHDPLHCIYKWQSVSDLINKYFMELQNIKLQDDICFGWNSILTSLMFDVKSQNLYYFSEKITTIKFKDQDLHSQLSAIGEKYYYEQKSLNQSITLSRNQNDSCGSSCLYYLGGVIQLMFGQIMYIRNYLTLSIILFFSFQNPYQLLNNVLNSKKGYFVLAFILPALYALILTSMLLLASQYAINTKIIKNSMLLRRKDQNLMKYFKLKSQSQINQQYILQKQQEGYEVQEEAVLILNIEKKFKCLFLLISLFDVLIAVFTICNLIVSYGPQLLDLSSAYKLVVIIFAIILLIILMFEGWIFGVYQFTKLILFTKYYICLSNKYSAEIKIKKRKSLALELFRNSIAYFIFIQIEAYFDYSGYVLLSLLVILMTIKILEYIMLTLRRLVNQKERYDKKATFLIDQQSMHLKTDKMNENFVRLVQKLNNYKVNQWQKMKDDEGMEDEKLKEYLEQKKQEYKKIQKESLEDIKKRANNKKSGVSS